MVSLREIVPAISTLVVFAVLVSAIIYYNALLGDREKALSACREEMGKLQERNQDLAKELDELNRMVVVLWKRLGGNITAISEQIKQLSTRMGGLQKDIIGYLGETCSSQCRSYEDDLKGYMEQLLKSYNENFSKKLEKKLDRLCTGNLQQLTGNIIKVREILEEKYAKLDEDYSKLKELLRVEKQWHMPLEELAEENPGTVKYILDVAEKGVRGILGEILGHGGGRGERPEQILLAVFNSTVVQLRLCNDSYTRVTDPSSMRLKVVENTLMLPNETWYRRCGDSEDLALLAYSALSATASEGEKVYLVLVSSGGREYSAIVVALQKEGGRRYYVLDPADDLLGSASLLVNVTGIEGKNTLYMNPLLVAGKELQKLIEAGVARLVYVDASSRKAVKADKVLADYVSAAEALQAWSRSLGISPEKVIVIAREEGVKQFYSLSEAAEWLEK